MARPELAGLEADLARCYKGKVGVGVPMADYTTWRIGGPADLLVTPRSVAEVRTCLAWAGRHGLPVWIIGNGSNVLVADGGLRGLVLRTAHGLNQIERQGSRLSLGAGALLPVLLRLAARYGWTGLEFAAGIPATVGGAVLMNAGTGEGTIGALVSRVGLIEPSGEYVELEAKEISFAYRHSSLLDRGGVITTVILQVREGDPADVARAIRERMAARRQKQPHRWPSAGSVFKNPPGWPSAGWLIERVGAKGLRRGGALVAYEHANFIVNTGGATARDVLWLVEEIRRRVRESFGVELETEIRILGDTRG